MVPLSITNQRKAQNRGINYARQTLILSLIYLSCTEVIMVMNITRFRS
jgi:hypothetical protein